MKQRSLSIFLVLALCLTLLPTAALASEPGEGQHANHCICGAAAHQSVGDHDTDASNTITWNSISTLSTISDDGYYYLTDDVNRTSLGWTVPEGKDITICLNGHMIKSNNQYSITVPADSTLTVTDCKGTGAITNTSYGSGTSVLVYGTFNLYAGSIDGQKMGNDAQDNQLGVEVASGATFNMYGGSITRNINHNRNSSTGGGVRVSDGATFTMYAGSISYNEIAPSDSSGGNGGGVYVAEHATFKMLGGSIDHNKAKSKGGGVYLEGRLDLSGSAVISDNEAGMGGGVYIGSTTPVGGIYGGGTVGTAVFNMSGGTISRNNSASGIYAHGGGVYMDGNDGRGHLGGTFNMSGGSITDNTADGNGGGLFFFSVVNLSGAPRITDNTDGTANGGSGRKSNAFIYNWKEYETRPSYETDYLNIAAAGLTDGAQIGVRSQHELAEGDANAKFATNATSANYFTSDQGYPIIKVGSDLYLQAPGSQSTHTHEWGYSESTNPDGSKTITATCKNTDGSCTDPNGADGGSITISKPLHEVYGDGKNEVVSVTGGFTGEGTATPIKSYKKSDGTALGTNPPHDAGSYIAVVTVGTTTVELPYTIAPKQVGADEITITQSGSSGGGAAVSYDYDGTKKTLTPSQITVTYTGDRVQPDFTLSGMTEGTNAGSYTATVTLTGNYSGSKDFTWTIAPRVATLDWQNTTGRKFGDGKTVTASVGNKCGNDAVAVIVTGGGETAVGSIYTATASGLTGSSAANYVLPASGLTAQYSIDKADAPALRAADINQKWNDTAEKTVTPAWSGVPANAGRLNFSATVKSAPAGVTLGSWSMDVNSGEIRYTLTGATAAHAGQQIVLEVLLTSANYADATTELKINLTAESSVSPGEAIMVDTGSRIELDKGENGTTSSDRASAVKGTAVIITAKPDEGYRLAEISVKDERGSSLPLTELGGDRYSFTMPDGKATVKVRYEKIPEISPFDDVPVDSYYYEAVKWAVKNGITTGVSERLFGPKQPCTRAQVVTFLWRAAGSPEPAGKAGFTDVPDDAYYAKAVAWAVEKGIATGIGGGQFAPKQACTRGQIAAFLWRAAGSPAPKGTGSFADVSADAYYAKAIAWAVENGITTGIGDGLFAPKDACTRAQIVTFLHRSGQAK